MFLCYKWCCYEHCLSDFMWRSISLRWMPMTVTGRSHTTNIINILRNCCPFPDWIYHTTCSPRIFKIQYLSSAFASSVFFFFFAISIVSSIRICVSLKASNGGQPPASCRATSVFSHFLIELFFEFGSSFFILEMGLCHIHHLQIFFSSVSTFHS